MNPDLSIIIVAYHCCDDLARCLECLPAAAGDLATETIVVDNASGDGTVEMVRERFPEVHLIANAENRGFAAANNQGLAVSSGRHVLFLNPDTRPAEGALAVLVRTLDADAELGAVGPQLLNEDGSVQPSVRTDPTLASLLHQYTPLRLLRVLAPAYHRYKRRDMDFGSAADVDTLMGAALCVPRGVLDEVGPMDERFFVYHDDADLCLRIRQAGYRVRFEPAARITHVGGVSAGHAASGVLYLRSLYRFLYKHHGPLKGGLMVTAVRVGLFVREALQLPLSGLAALALLLAGRADRARRHGRRAVRALRHVCCDAWRTLFV
ncbi:MAG: glycosyltransferase family 2 protein [Phycisphaerae bacterium]